MISANTLNRVERACAKTPPPRPAGHLHRHRRRHRHRPHHPLPRSRLRAVINQHRHRAATSGTLTGLTDEIATLRTALETIATRVRHHEEQLRRLTAQKH